PATLAGATVPLPSKPQDCWTASAAKSSPPAIWPTPRAALTISGNATTPPGGGTYSARIRCPATTSTKRLGPRRFTAHSHRNGTVPYGLGYYSYQVGDWHVVALNSNWDAVPVVSGSAQAQWLRADLTMHPSKCTLAYWHHALFTSGPDGEQTAMRDIWRILYDANADVIVNAHDHLYERFAPQDPDGRSDSARGIREL